ncbi:MAG: hypothetical protein JSW20_13605, partial [Nitrospiraceae bacterium]
YIDSDGDGYGNSATFIDSCTDPDQDNYVTIGDDCDDSKPQINPSAKEICGNDIDEDCDGIAKKECDCNDGDTRTCGTDTGACVSGVESCVNNEWSGFCDDEIGPAEEICDGLDNDCNGQVDENLSRATTCGVGECAGNTGTETCTNGEWGNDNCDPLAGATFEICDDKDNDCDGNTDETFTDLGDSCSVGKGECKETGTIVCNASGTGTTCDATEGIPSAEICDGKDNNCDGNTDEGVKLTYYRDSDNDTYGDPDTITKACSMPLGYRNDNTDCNDNNASINPGATEICDDIDNNCDDSTDEGCDNDNDNYCDAKMEVVGTPGTCSNGGGDCEDNDEAINPGATEICNDDKDNDCDGNEDAKDPDCQMKLTINPSRSVTVISSPGSINCGEKKNKICTEVYTKDTVVILSHNCQSSIRRWLGDVDCTDDGNGDAEVKMDSDITCEFLCF